MEIAAGKAIDGEGPLEVRPGRTLLCVGTRKGLWLFSSDDRVRWIRHGPFLPGRPIPAVLAHTYEGGVRLVSTSLDANWSMTISYSDDLGTSWTEAEASPRFPSEWKDVRLRSIWALEASPDGTLYAGVEPAALFRSDDAGNRWELVPGLWNHPHRPLWEPGGGGLCLHTIVFDPHNTERMFVAISSGGVYRTDDGGETWIARNEGIETWPNTFPEFGQCVHKVGLSAHSPQRMYLQNHGGVYRSDDGGDRWEAKEQGLPGNFGFPLVVHPRDPETAYVLPLEGEGFPLWTHSGRLVVYRTRNGGDSWEPLHEGLPEAHAYLTVLRDAMCSDGSDPLGLYIGTKQGHVFHSADEGDHWSCIADMLPTILTVKAYQW